MHDEQASLSPLLSPLSLELGCPFCASSSSSLSWLRVWRPGWMKRDRIMATELCWKFTDPYSDVRKTCSKEKRGNPRGRATDSNLRLLQDSLSFESLRGREAGSLNPKPELIWTSCLGGCQSRVGNLRVPLSLARLAPSEVEGRRRLPESRPKCTPFTDVRKGLQEAVSMDF